MSLTLGFSGWCLMRLATDPDPTDEPRGVSGYTFAFGDEPDLDRLVRFQPPAGLIRPNGEDWRFGVLVTNAIGGTDDQELPDLVGATVDLVGEPKMENRNWTLTLPGQEPIVPFQLRIARADPPLAIGRDGPLTAGNLAQATPDQIAVYSAQGFVAEPHTVGYATGIWSSLTVARRRLQWLQHRPSRGVGGTAVRAGRIAELQKAVADPSDRRIQARYFIERFAFSLAGDPGTVAGDETALGGKLDVSAPWQVAFWIGAWDADLLSAFVQGSLTIPYA